jgi:hypothetical protein
MVIQVDRLGIAAGQLIGSLLSLLAVLHGYVLVFGSLYPLRIRLFS